MVLKIDIKYLYVCSYTLSYKVSGRFSKGISRFEAYRNIQRIAFKSIESGEHFLKSLSIDDDIMKNITIEELSSIFNPQNQLCASNQIIDNIIKKAERMKIFL